MALTCGYCSTTCKKSESFICAICNNCQHYNCILQQTPTMTQAMKDNITKTKTGKKCVEKSSMNPINSKFNSLEKQLQDLTNFIKDGIASQLSEMKTDLANTLSHSKKFEDDTTSKLKHLERDNNNLRKQINRPDIIISGLKSNMESSELYSAAISIGKACG
ncbi:hypothetical protein FF38_07448 [Lucilia cuprina]|uniref:Phorbol-ester/DAG-type domain-containing protein n=1 Tax=Lucilia cuprina TaxID=7375 RepID=A0A0L0BVT9_LUCCU|nr:hypothetical protein FF38_07448 [Lucilia cuprina]